ncbi:AAA family ATPase [Endozoicomonas atrinae]|uniref:AAA family ATPase n=1 Tax=Endozoicomonas atrinae TaxID=1333660 RepID=UPI000AC5CD31|nr:AAA family ATPase [Endozoicomonas atrinae]
MDKKLREKIFVNRRIQRCIIYDPVYESRLARYSNNPLTESMYSFITKNSDGDFVTKKNLFGSIRKLPYHQDRDENGKIDLDELYAKDRSLISMGLTDCCLPDKDLWFEIWNEITDVLMDAYVYRNPLSSEHIRHLTSLSLQNRKNPDEVKQKKKYLFTPRKVCLTCTKTSVFLGITGAGKTFMIESILSVIPNIIYHKRYKNLPINFAQITWVKIDCLPSGSEKGICLQYLATLDYLLGHIGKDCYFKPSSHNKSIDILQLEMAIASTIHNVGFLVIDDSENILNNKEHERLTAFLSALVNCVGVSVLYMGTTKMWKLFTSEKTKDFSAIRRIATGFFYQVTRYNADDKFWRQLVQLFWINLMAKEKVNLTGESEEEKKEAERYYSKIYDYTQGIPAILASYMHRCNRYLVNKQLDEINEAVLDYVFEYRMIIIHEGIKALRGDGPNPFGDLEVIQQLLEEDRAEMGKPTSSGLEPVMEEECDDEGEDSQDLHPEPIASEGERHDEFLKLQAQLKESLGQKS